MRTLHFAGPPKLARLVGNSRAITAVRAKIEMLADSNALVLITGPSVSGKDVVAQLLHRRSRRAVRPFVPLNCVAVPRICSNQRCSAMRPAPSPA